MSFLAKQFLGATRSLALSRHMKIFLFIYFFLFHQQNTIAQHLFFPILCFLIIFFYKCILAGPDQAFILCSFNHSLFTSEVPNNLFSFKLIS